MSDTDLTEAVYAALLTRHADFSPEEIASTTGIDASLVTAALESLVSEGRASVLSDGRYFSSVAAKRLTDTARRALTTFHRQNPYRQAMSRHDFKASLTKAATIQNLRALLSWLAEQGVLIAESDGRLRLPEHTIVLPLGWQKPSAEMLAVYESAGLVPPFPGNFQANYPRDVNVRTILDALTDQGKLVRLADDLYISQIAFEETKTVIRRLAGTPDGITVGGLRDATNSSRKICVSLLEYLDNKKWTRRVGDARVLQEENEQLE